MLYLNQPVIAREERALGQLIDRARDLGNIISGRERTNLKDALECGRILNEIKERCPHGEWLKTLERTGIAQQRAWEYMHIAKLPAPVISACQSIRDAVGNVTEGPTTAELIVSSNGNEWYTPPAYVEAARDVLGAIDLDPASCKRANKTVKAKEFFTVQDNGLEQPWAGNVWLNPPYGGLAGKFVEKAVKEYQDGNIEAAILLVNANCTDTDWFKPLWDYLLCFTDHRINFESESDESSGSTHGSVFVYLGSQLKEFAKCFSQFGTVVRKL